MVFARSNADVRTSLGICNTARASLWGLLKASARNQYHLEDEALTFPLQMSSPVDPPGVAWLASRNKCSKGRTARRSFGCLQLPTFGDAWASSAPRFCTLSHAATSRRIVLPLCGVLWSFVALGGIHRRRRRARVFSFSWYFCNRRPCVALCPTPLSGQSVGPGRGRRGQPGL